MKKIEKSIKKEPKSELEKTCFFTGVISPFEKAAKGSNSNKNENNDKFPLNLKGNDFSSEDKSKRKNYFYSPSKLPSNIKSCLTKFISNPNKKDDIISNSISLVIDEKTSQPNEIHDRPIVLNKKRRNSIHLNEKKKTNVSKRDLILSYNNHLNNDVINLMSGSNFIPRDKICYSTQRKTQVKMFKVYKSHNKKLLSFSVN